MTVCGPEAGDAVRTSDFDYELPPDRVAQHPAAERSDARMLVVDRAERQFEHRRVRDLADYVKPGDVLVVNDTRVIPARLLGHKAGTGGRAEVLLLEETKPGVWDALCHASRRLRVGMELILAAGVVRGRVLSVEAGGRACLALKSDRPLGQVLEEKGLPPLPPYIRRDWGKLRAGADPYGAAAVAEDRERYQTVYAKIPGAVAAPTAGLHFTVALLRQLERKGVRRVDVTLHVGPGTFKPVTTEHVEEHRMEGERYVVSGEAAAAINEGIRAGRRIIAVGTTAVRVLESVAMDPRGVAMGEGRTTLFIHPPYRFRVVDVMLTNFHLPRSTLLMLVSAFADRDLVLEAYREAVRREYRFYSYGDCMLIL